MSSERRNPDGNERRATMQATERDTRMSGQLIEQLVQAWTRDASLVDHADGGGTVLALAAEASEFGLLDGERAQRLYGHSAEHDDADPRAFAGVRRLARLDGDVEALIAGYRNEARKAGTPDQALAAGVGLAQALLREGQSAAEAERLLRDLEPLVAQASPDVAAAWRSVLEDVLFAAGRPASALQLRVQRWSDLGALGEELADRYAASSALAIAAASEAVGAAESGIREWYEVVFELERSSTAARPLVRAAHDRGEPAAAEALISEMVEAEDDATVRSLYQYEQGLLRSRRLDDRAGGLGALSAALKGSDASPLVASTFLSEARTQQGFVGTDDFVDALGVGLGFAASGVERADYLTRLATRLDVDLGLTEQAVDYARDALTESPGHLPAFRLLGSIFARESRWADLADLGETQLQGDVSEAERLRLHERQADLYLNDLGDHVAAERHLRAALDLDCHLPVVRRLARVLAGQHRWEDLFDHLREAAARVRLERERAFLLERAADVAEARLRDPSLAIEVYRELLEVEPAHAAAISNLGRLLSQQRRWAELFELNERELELTPDDTRVRVGILCRSAEIARRQLSDMAAAESYYRRALDEDPTCGEALQGLGQVLTAHERWDELVAMTEREMAHAPTETDRRRCLQLLGELHATRTGDSSEAIRCFEELASGRTAERAHALVWLDRLYQATDSPQERLRVLASRHADADDPGSRARLAFRIGELLEWHLEVPREAFENYVEALADLTAAPVAIAALDRIWATPDITDDERVDGVRCVSELAARVKGPLRRQALLFLVERGAAHLSENELDAHWRSLASEWPTDVRAAEYCAVRALGKADARTAEGVRSTAPAGPVEIARTHWAAIDDGAPRLDLERVPVDAVPVLAGVLARDAGDVAAEFDGAIERDTFTRMAAGHITLGELRQPDGTEAGLRLSALAARLLDDNETLRLRWEELAAGLNDPVRQLRAWLDLASEDGFSDDDRREWLRHAASLDCFHPVLRAELYDRMQQIGDFEGLDGAIIVHLTQARPDARAAADLALRRGRSLEMQGKRPEAIDALRYAVEHAPGDSGIAIEKARLETLDDRLEDARASLQDCLDAGVQGADRIEVLRRLADLHQMNGGSRQHALACLEDAYVLSGNAKEWAVRLASVHAAFGHPERCVELLEEHLPEPPEVDDIRHWQLLARVYSESIEDAEAAAEILWMLFRAFPERRATLVGLQEFYKRNGGARALADGLGNLLAANEIKVDAPELAGLWKYVGELNLSVLERLPEAEEAFGRARALGDQSADAILRHAKAVARQPGRVREAVPLLVDALENGSGDAKLWEDAFAQLEDLFRDMQMHGRLRIARQVRATLGANVELLEEHVRRDPTREIQANSAWSLIGSNLLEQSDASVLLACAPLAERVFSRYAPTRKTLKGRRLRREEYTAFDTFLANACNWLGLAVPKVFVGDGGRGVTAFDLSNVWVPDDRISDANPLRARFWAGWTAGLLFSESVPFTWVDDTLVEEFFRGVAARSDIGDFGPTTLDDEIGSLLLMPQRRAATAAMGSSPEFMAAESRDWTLVARSFADRAGLIMCGDLRTAVEEVLVASGWDRKLENPRTRELVVGDPRLRSLLLYAIGDQHFLARYESGLSERPFLFA